MPLSLVETVTQLGGALPILAGPHQSNEFLNAILTCHPGQSKQQSVVISMMCLLVTVTVVVLNKDMSMDRQQAEVHTSNLNTILYTIHVH